jgi:hypothetical protein
MSRHGVPRCNKLLQVARQIWSPCIVDAICGLVHRCHMAKVSANRSRVPSNLAALVRAIVVALQCRVVSTTASHAGNAASGACRPDLPETMRSRFSMAFRRYGHVVRLPVQHHALTAVGEGCASSRYAGARTSQVPIYTFGLTPPAAILRSHTSIMLAVSLPSGRCRHRVLRSEDSKTSTSKSRRYRCVSVHGMRESALSACISQTEAKTTGLAPPPAWADSLRRRLFPLPPP